MYLTLLKIIALTLFIAKRSSFIARNARRGVIIVLVPSYAYSIYLETEAYERRCQGAN